MTAVALGLAGPLLAVTGIVPATAPSWVQVLGLVVALVGVAATLAAQTGTGASSRIGADVAERTALVTDGVFAHVRNPNLTAMVFAQAGVLVIVPTWVSALALLALVVAVQLQARAVEEPYLQAVHGETYRA